MPSPSNEESAFQPSDNAMNDKMHIFIIREDVKQSQRRTSGGKGNKCRVNSTQELKMDGMIVTDNAARTVRMFRNALESLVSKVSVGYKQRF